MKFETPAILVCRKEDPWLAFPTYRRLYLVLQLLNETFNPLLLPTVQLVLVVNIVGCNYAVIRGEKFVESFGLFVYIVCPVQALHVLLIGYLLMRKLEKINCESQKFLQVMEVQSKVKIKCGNGNFVLGRGREREIQIRVRQWRSLRTMRVEIGKFYFVDPCAALGFLTTVIDSTVNALLLF